MTITVAGTPCAGRLIGGGKFSKVWALDVPDGSPAAMRIAGSSVVAKSVSEHCSRERLIHARLASGMRSRHFVPTLFGDDDSGRYFLMGRVSGRHLHEAAPLLEPIERLALAVGLACAYKAIQNAGVLHRDVWGAKLIATGRSLHGRWPRVVVLDFGLAVTGRPDVDAFAGRYQNPDGWAQERTAAPEAHEIGVLTNASETYAVSAMVWRLFDVEYPFGPFRKGISLREQRDNCRDLPLEAEKLGLRSFFERALSTDPVNRFRHMSLVVQSLAERHAAASRRS